MSNGSNNAELATQAEPDFVSMEVQALASLVTDLAAVVAAIAPGSLDRTLQTAGVRLQDLQVRPARAAEAFKDEATILHFKVSTLEIALGRSALSPRDPA